MRESYNSPNSEESTLGEEVSKYLQRFEAREDDEWYNFFRSNESRSELVSYCKKIAEHLHDAKIPNMVIIDRSSRPLYIGVMEYWKKDYPDEKLPGIYFMNPKGFKAKELLTEEELRQIQIDCEWKNDIKETHTQARTEEEIVLEIQQTYSKLFEDKDKPLLVFDSCIHSGDTLAPLKEILEKTGFSQIEIGAVVPSDSHSKVSTDFFITEERPDKGCYPFDKDRMIEKTFDHVYSQKTKSPKTIALGIMLRKEIKRIIGKAMDEEGY